MMNTNSLNSIKAAELGGLQACLEVLLQLARRQVQLFEALQKGHDANRAIILDLHDAPNQGFQLALHDYNPVVAPKLGAPCRALVIAQRLHQLGQLSTLIGCIRCPCSNAYLQCYWTVQPSDSTLRLAPPPCNAHLTAPNLQPWLRLGEAMLPSAATSCVWREGTHLVEALQLLQGRHALLKAEVAHVVAAEQVTVLEAPVADAVEEALAVMLAQLLYRKPRIIRLLV